MRKKTHKMLFVTLILIIYVILKIYVLNTPETKDDDVPDLLLKLLATQEKTIA